MRRALLGPAGAALLLVGCGGGSKFVATTPGVTTPSDYVIDLHVVLTKHIKTIRAPECTGSGSYSDIKLDAPVTVTDGGTVISKGSLDPGLFKGKNCEFSFFAEHVPSASSYTFHIGKHAGPTYSAQQIVADDGPLEVTLK